MLNIFSRSMLVVAQIVILAGAAFWAKKICLLGKAALDGCVEVLMSISVPASILVAAKNIVFTPETMRNIFLVLAVTVIQYLVMFVLGHGFSRAMHLHPQQKSVFICTSVFKNIAFLGFPMCITVLGPDSIFYAVFPMAMFNVFMWTYGVMLYSNDSQIQLKKLLTNPALIACMIMIILAVAGIPLPDTIWDTLELAGNTCTPLSLFVVGMMLADCDLLRVLRKPQLLLSSAMLLIVAPVLIFLLVLLFRPGKDAVAVLLTLSTVPAATLNPVVAKQYGADYETSSAAVIHSMLLSLITMPVLITVLLSLIGHEI